MDLRQSLFGEPGDIDTFAAEMGRVSRIRGRVDWKDPAFSQEKAFITGVIAKIAYLLIPDYELPSYGGAKVIPCFTWDEIRRGGRRDLAFLRKFISRAEFDGANAFILPVPHAVVVGISCPDVVFIALRGTRPLYLSDWRTDVAAGPRRITASNSAGTHPYAVHAGFFDAVHEFLTPLADWLEAYLHTQSHLPPVYVAGHSLGGAMAAVLQALDGAAVSEAAGAPLAPRRRLGIHATYTFGMPRYGDAGMVTRLAAPFHVYRPEDAVPTVPPAGMGFADAADEYCLSGGTLTRHRTRPVPGVREAALRIAIWNHFMEKYVVRLGAINGIPL